MYIYSSNEIKHIDHLAASGGLNVFTLMESAGKALYEAIVPLLTKKKSILIMAGTGNNGGDGIVLARYLQQNGYTCELALPIGKPKSKVSLQHFSYYMTCGLKVGDASGQYDVIVDALLGAGASPPLREEMAKSVVWANKQQALKIAVDLPTGVSADDGETELAFCADYTFCLHGYKPSAFLEGSTDYYGKIDVLEIGLPQISNWRVWTKENVKSTFHKRNPGTHKGSFGTGLLIAGSDEMPGSALLAGKGAIRSGIGKLQIATTRYVSSILAGHVPEATYMHEGLSRLAEGEIPKGLKAAAAGPGLNNETLIEQALDHLFQTEMNIILDAGALLQPREYPSRKGHTIVTPHPGEFSRMTGNSVADIQKNRLTAASEYAVKQGVIVILKGRHTVIAHPDGEVCVNLTGNAGLAKGGTGDTLTGMLLAFISAEPNLKAAIANAVYFHGASAEHWSQAERGLAASDLSDLLPVAMKPFEN